MERKEFIRRSIGALGMALIAPSILRRFDSESTSCTATVSETAGPFPTINPSSLVQSNIVGDRTGVPLTITINIRNLNADCGVLEGALVDIWHCDKDGNYSEYGGTNLQPTNYTNYHFLRGRQVTSAAGTVSFTSIFPGWYTGRATHIHVHIYNSAGISLLVTQIAFPEGATSAVVAVNAQTALGYTKGMSGYTYNASDNVFSNGTSTEMAAITGSVSQGYALEHTIYVAGPLSVESTPLLENEVGTNYPNPFSSVTTIPLTLTDTTEISVELFDLSGRKVGRLAPKLYTSGSQEIQLYRNDYQLAAGIYLAQVQLRNSSGSATKSLRLLVK